MITQDRARLLLEDELLLTILDEIERDAVSALATCALSDAIALQKCAAALQAARDFRARLNSLANNYAALNEKPVGIA